MALLAGKVALITGAGQGIGEGVAKTLAMRCYMNEAQDIAPAVEAAVQHSSSYAAWLVTASTIIASRKAARDHWRDHHAIAGECFPPAAMSNEAAFFDAVGDEARFADHKKRMMESCEGFSQFGELDVIPTSQYVY